MQRQLSLRHWFTLLIMLTGLVAYGTYDHTATWRRAEENITSIARLVEEHLSRSISETQLVLNQVTYRVGQEGEPQFARQGMLRRILIEEIPNLPHLRSLTIIDSKGQLVATSHRELAAPVLVRDRDYFQHWLVHGGRELFLGTPIKSRVNTLPESDWVMTFTLPIQGPGKQFLGVVLATIDCAYFARTYSTIDIGGKTQITIMRRDGILLARTPHVEELMGRSLAGGPVFRDGLSRSNNGLMRYVSVVDKEDRLSDFRRLSEWPIVLVVGMSANDINQQWGRRLGYITLLMVIFLAVFTRMYRRQRNQMQISEQATQALRENESRFRSVFYHAPVGHLLIRLPDCSILDVNPAFCRISGYSREELCRKKYSDITPSIPSEEAEELLARLLEKEHFGPDDQQIIHKDGKLVWIRSSGSIVTAPNGDQHLLSVAEDISQQRQAESRIRLLASVFDHSGEGFLVTDHQNRILEVNSSFTRITGYLPEEVVGRNPSMLASGRTTREDYEAMWKTILSVGLWQGEIWDRHKDGHVYPKWLTISVVRDDKDRITHFIGSFTDISEHKAAEERIHYLAHHDVLTRLPNRFNLEGRLEQALATAQRNQQRVAVMFIDLDRFKNINDTLGHQAGDQILLEVARRLKECVRSSDIVARLGGDEFVVALNEISPNTVPGFAHKIMGRLSAPYWLGNRQLTTTPSIGISLFPEDGKSVEELMKNADTAMYHAKSVGRNNYQFFTAALNESAVERMTLEDGLRQALEQRKFVLHYQPQVEIASGRPVSAEALIRWTHPELGVVPPLKFIPVAEETGLIIPLGKWIIDEALRQLTAWHRAGIPLQRISVNLSAHQLRDASLQAYLSDRLGHYGLHGNALELEITESVAMQHPERTVELLVALRGMGIELAIDDFGTGYSSLAYLKRLPLNRLKLDRSFVMDILHDSNDATISAATISLAHSLGLAVVAEGVEESGQLDFLRNLHCDLSQGYFHSRPLPADQCSTVLREMMTSATDPDPMPCSIEYHL